MIEELKNLNIGQVLENELMKYHTTFKIGGPAKIMCLPDSFENARKLIEFLRNNNEEFYILGNGSNLLVSDKGLDLVVVKIAGNLSEIKVEGETVSAMAGASLIETSREAIRAGLEGMEFSSGIPGNVGGALTMNAGAYGNEIIDILHTATVINQDNEIVEIPVDQMNLRYRNSRIQDEGLVALGAKFQLKYGDQEKINAKYEDLKNRRWTKQPLDKRSAGSTFKRPEGHYASKLIQDAGLKGYKYNNAMVSDKHSGFVIAENGASFNDVIMVIKHVQEVVYEKFGVRLEPEVRILGE